MTKQKVHPRSIAQIHRQLDAMGCTTFELGTILPNEDGRLDRQPLEEGKRERNPTTGISVCSREWFDDVTNLEVLAEKNKGGCHIYIRPFGDHNLSLVDDLTADSLKSMKDAGFEPAAVVQTSPGNFQAWLKHANVIALLPEHETDSKGDSTYAAQILARRFDGDKNAAKGRGFGRLAGFTNRKDKYFNYDGNGHYPYSILIEANGKSFTRATEFMTQLPALISAEKEREATERGAGARSPEPSNTFRPRAQRYKPGQRLKTLADFRRSEPGKSGHEHDMQYLCYLLGRGVPDSEILSRLDNETTAQSADRPGTRKRDEYINHSLKKAKKFVGSVVQSSISDTIDPPSRSTARRFQRRSSGIER